MKLLFSFCFLFATVIYAQTRIHGVIRQNTGEPLIGATILLNGTFDGAVTDTTGQYVFTTNEKGTRELTVKYLGFKPQTISVELLGNPLEISPILKAAVNTFDAVTITAGAFEAGDEKKSVALTPIDMVTVPGAQGNVVSALQYLPGTTTNGESGRLFVRGGSSHESQVYVDGTLVHIPYNPSAPNTAVRSKFNPFMFKGTVFSTGGFSAAYGQALSSVLLLETKDIPKEDQLDISLLSVGLGLAGTKKWKTGALTANIDYTNLSPYFWLYPQRLDWVKPPTALNNAINFRQKTKNGMLKLHSTYSHTQLEMNQPQWFSDSITHFKLTNKNQYTNLSWKGQVAPNWILKLGGSLTFNRDDITTFPQPVRQDLTGSHLKITGIRSFNNRIKLLAGAEYLFTQYLQEYGQGDIAITNKYNNSNWASFIETNIHFSKNWVARIGGRAEHSVYLNQTHLSPRLSMAYKLNSTSQVSAAYGHFYQLPLNNYLLYTSQLDFERADQYMLNFQWQKNKRTLRSEVYYKQYDQLVKFTDMPFYLPAHYTNNGNGYAYGIDLFFRDRKTIKNGDYWISYSYIDTKRNQLNYPESTTPGFVSKHNISVIYKHWIRPWRSLVGLSFNYSSPRRYNDPNSATFNDGRMKPYQTLNANWSYLHREHIIFYFSASNLLGYQQEFGYEFSPTPNAEGIYENRLIEPPADRFFVVGCFITLTKSGTENQLDKIQ